MAPAKVPAGRVRLDVGGKIFVTKKETLSNSPFFTRLFETNAQMPDAKAGSDTPFIDRNPDCFAKVLEYLRTGKLLVGKNYNLEALRLEAAFYRLDKLVKIIDDTKARNELRSTTKCVVVSHNKNSKSVEIAVSPRDINHFLILHLQKRYPCRAGAIRFQFPYTTFELKACSTCRQCATVNAILKDVATSLEKGGYDVDPTDVKADFAAGGCATSWTFVKREG